MLFLKTIIMANKQTTAYTYIFGLIMTVVVAFALAGFKTGTADLAARNADIFNKREILATVANPLADAGVDVGGLTDDQVEDIFNEQVESIVVNGQGEEVEGVTVDQIDLAKELKKPEAARQYPLNILNLDGDSYYIFSVRGNGLWDAIWGNIALEGDMNTIAGASFDHAGETPGLGAEIKDNDRWKAQFVGKQIYDGNEFVSVIVKKGGATDPDHEVDGLSGATVTADGVTKMLWNGLKAYEPFIESKRREQNSK